MEAEVHCRLNKNPPLVPILGHMHPVHSILPYFPKIYSNIFPSTPMSSLQVFRQKFYMHFSCLPYVSLAPPISSFKI